MTCGVTSTAGFRLTAGLAIVLAVGSWLPGARALAQTDTRNQEPLSQQSLLQEAPSPALLDSLALAMATPGGFDDAFDAQVWLLDMQSRLARRQPKAFADRQARLEFLQRIYAEASRVALPPEVVLALIDVESRFQPAAISSAGAQGLMQVMPFWKDEIGRPQDDLTDLDTNLRYGCTILAHYLEREDGDWTRALARYNGSLGRTIYPELVMAAWFERWWVNR